MLISRKLCRHGDDDAGARGKQRAALPVIRESTEHSEHLMESAECVWSTLSSHLSSENVLVDPWMSLANGEELTRVMLMICLSSHVDQWKSHSHYSWVDLADLHHLESVTCWRFGTANTSFEVRPGAAVSAEQVFRAQ